MNGFATFVLLLALVGVALGGSARAYRPYNGVGNNVDNPDWGAGMKPFVRTIITTNSYADGIFAVGFKEPQWPNPRMISNAMAKAAFNGHPKTKRSLNEFHTYWGQFMTVDIVDTFRPEFQPDAPDFYDNDRTARLSPSMIQHCHFFAAALLYVPEWLAFDRWFNPLNLSEVPQHFFMRAAAANGTGVPGVPRVPLNTQTSYLDLSMVYFQQGFPSPWADPVDPAKLNPEHLMTDVPYHLPFENWWRDERELWVESGDIRTNKTPPIRAIFDLFIKEHNWRVDFLRNQTAFNGYSNEEIYQEARRWTIAVYQSLSVREYLASTIGRPLPPYIDPNTLTDSYDPAINPGLDLHFGVAAFRYGHSAVTNHFPRTNNDGTESREGHLDISLSLFHPHEWVSPDPNDDTLPDRIQHGCLFRGLSHILAGEVDVGFTDSLRNNMFFGLRNGMDLFMTNIARGRDTGLLDYNAAREALGLPRKNSWAEITSDRRVQKMLEDVYGHDTPGNNCDVYVCGLAEGVGELFALIIEKQMLNLRNGDRFWFERDMTPTEVQEVYGVKLNELLVKHYPDIAPESLPVSPFYVFSRQLITAHDRLFGDYPDSIDGMDFKGMTVRDIAPSYRMRWSFNDDYSKITFVLQTRFMGWVGIGFDPEPNTMKNADIILCRINPDNGQGECRDSYAADVGPPLLDTALGGTGDLTDVSVVQEDGFTTAKFTRPTKATNGRWDKNLAPANEQPLRLIFAYHPETNELLYHGPTRSAELMISFVGEYVAPPKPTNYGLGLIIVVAIVAALGIIFSIFNMIIIFLKTDYYRFQTPLFCHIILVGTWFGYAAVILTLPQQTTVLCTLEVWFFALSFTLVFASLFAKVWRVWRIASVNNLSKNVRITELDIAKPVLLLILVDVIYLVVWTVIDIPTARDVTFTDGIYTTCSSSGMWWWIILLSYKGVFLVVGVFLAFLSRNLDTALSDSKQVALCLYVMFIEIIILVTVGYSLSNIPLATFVIFAFGIALAYITVTVILFAKTLVRIFSGQEPKLVKRTGVTTQRGGTARTTGTAATTTGTTTGGSTINEDGPKAKQQQPVAMPRTVIAPTAPISAADGESSSGSEIGGAAKEVPAVESQDEEVSGSGTGTGEDSSSGSVIGGPAEESKPSSLSKSGSGSMSEGSLTGSVSGSGSPGSSVSLSSVSGSASLSGSLSSVSSS